MKVYREMSENDPVIGSMLLAVDLSMRQVDWSVTPAVVDSPEAEQVAEFV
jgi:hypothetical protein